MKRIGILSFIHESNTFLPIPTTYEHFERATITIGDELLKRWEGKHHEVSGFIDGARELGFEPVPLMASFAMPAGTITAETFDRLMNESAACLKAAMPLDGVLLSLHGAAVSAEYPDADGEAARRVREAVGPELPIICTLDLHANVTQKLAANTNALIIYRSCPHLDQRQRGREAAALMMKTVNGEVHPVQWLETPPLIVNMVKQDTSKMPAKGLYDDVEAVTHWPGILSASIAMGFYYADVEELGASFLAVADGDIELAKKAARWMADRAWGRREEFRGQVPEPDEAVRYAGQAANLPIVLMDIGDNVGGGSPGDSTIILEEIVKQNVPNACVVLYDPESVEACVRAGVRQTVQLHVGGKTDKLHGSPVPITGRVRCIHEGRFTETQVRHGAWGVYDQGVTAVVETDEQHTIVLTSYRQSPTSLEQILSLGIKPERKRILVVKGVIAPLAAYRPVAGEIMWVNTAGATTADPAKFDYQHRRRPLFPLERDAAYEPEAAAASR